MAEEPLVHILWLNSGLGCDGDSVALTAAMQPSIEDIVLGTLPGLPRVAVHWLLIDYQVGDEFMQWFWKADRNEIDPFVLVVEGSIPNEEIKREGYWAAMGNREEHGGRESQPMTTSEWLERLAPKAWAVLAVALVVYLNAWRRRPNAAERLVERYLSENRVVADWLGQPVKIQLPERIGKGAANDAIQMPVTAQVTGPLGGGEAHLTLARVSGAWEVLHAELDRSGKVVSLSSES